MDAACMEARIQDLLVWKLAGAAAWHSALFAGAALAWHIVAWPGRSHAWDLYALGTLVQLLGIYVTAFLVLGAQRLVLAAQDVPPLRIPRLGLPRNAWPCIFLARCVLRQRQLPSMLHAVALYASCILSGALAVAVLSAPADRHGVGAAAQNWQGVRWMSMYGALLGWAYATDHLIRAKNILSFPVLQQHRFQRMRGHLAAVVRSAFQISSTWLLVALVAAVLLPAARPGGVMPVARAWCTAVFISIIWICGAHLLDVVFTEALALVEPNQASSAAPLIHSLKHRNPIVQAWALADLAAVAEGGPQFAARRTALFEDETGANGWVPIIGYCMAEVNDLVAAVAAGAKATAAPGGGVASVAPRWAALQQLLWGSAPAPGMDLDLASWHVQARYQRASCCLRALSGLAAASLRADRCGVAQLAAPNLADVVLALLVAVAALRAYSHALTASLGPATSSRWPPPLASFAAATGLQVGACGASLRHEDVAAAALLDTAVCSTYCVTDTFGAVLQGVLARATMPPTYGTPADAAKLLASFLAHEL